MAFSVDSTIKKGERSEYVLNAPPVLLPERLPFTFNFGLAPSVALKKGALQRIYRVMVLLPESFPLNIGVSPSAPHAAGINYRRSLSHTHELKIRLNKFESRRLFCKFLGRWRDGDGNWLKMNIKRCKKLALVLYEFNAFIFIDEGLKESTYGTYHAHKHKPQLWRTAASG